jgi:hypothetical protein
MRQIASLLIVHCLVICHVVAAWQHAPKKSTRDTFASWSLEANVMTHANINLTRREALLFGALIPPAVMSPINTLPAFAYTPDPDKLRESLYLISRVQEATVQQERFVLKSTMQEDLKNKLKLTLKLVEKNYRLLDQINYASSFVDPKDELVIASEAGYEAVDALQGAIDFVKNDLGVGPLSDSQRNFLMSSMQTCREDLFMFLKYMPSEKLEAARKRVEEENVLNREEYDGDKDAGVYNPVVLPWKQQK